jgi:hypothetical protein
LRKNKNFGFGSVLCAFFFERVLGISPRTHVREHQRTWPTLIQWIELLTHLAGGAVFNPFSDDFFDWWARQIPTIEDYPYVGIDFSQDPDMVIPPDAMLGEIGKLFIFLVI